HAHAKTHAVIAITRFEEKIKDHAAKAQQRNVMSSQTALPLGAVRARAIGARTTARNPKIIRPSEVTGSIREPPPSSRSTLTAMITAPFTFVSWYSPCPMAAQ